MSGWAWRTEASCLALDPEEFFPGRNGRPSKAATRVCGDCPVRTECLDAALAFGERCEGFWAGTSQAQRRRMLASS